MDELEATGLALPDEVRDALLRLGRHYLPARYPDSYPAGSPGGHYGATDARQALADAEAVLWLIDRGWDELACPGRRRRGEGGVSGARGLQRLERRRRRGGQRRASAGRP